MTKNKGLNDTKPPPLPGYVVGKRAEPGRSFEEQSAVFLAKLQAKELSIDECVEHFHRLQDTFFREVEELCQQSGWNPDFLAGYLSNPSNFSNDEWQLINQEKQLLKEKYQPKIEGLGLPRDVVDKFSKKTGQDLGSSSKPFTGSKEDKKIRSKSAGARRKWIPMR